MPVARSFASLERGTPFPWRFAAAARNVADVATPDGHVVVWAPPVHAGGFCIVVSSPIDAGFFVLWTDRSHWRDGKERFETAPRDENGKKLDEATIEVGAPAPS